MALFTTEERKDISEYIVTIAKENEHIMALVAVGSGAVGYTDALSDIDFVVAIDRYENLDAVRENVAAAIGGKVPLLYFKQSPYAPLQVYVCENFLEIDIGYGVYTSAAATRAHWKVLFDKTGTVEEAMRISWEKAENQPQTEQYVEKCAQCADTAWHNLMHSAVAIKRKQYWRAASEMEVVRNMLVELLGIRYALDTKRGREVDQLPAGTLEVLAHTLVRNFAPETLWNSLIALTDALYTELEASPEQARVGINRRYVREYIDDCRNYQ